MIFKIRDRLKDADQNECFSMLFKYPEIKDIMDIIKLAKKVEQAINERLNGKNSNIYDILGIMKPIESQPSHLFSPPMYNQPLIFFLHLCIIKQVKQTLIIQIII